VKTSVHIGTQGWIYDDWLGPLYPPGTSRKEMLKLYSKVFDTVEIDSTFYAVPSESTIGGWCERTPKDFKFSVKVPSEITHKKRLRITRNDLADFTDRIRGMGEKLGAVLIQLPPDFSPLEYRSLISFLDILPADLRFAVEFRDSSWLTKRVLRDLTAHNVALTLCDSRWINRDLSLSLVEQPTSSFSYVRWLGPMELTDFSRIQIDRNSEMEMWREAFLRLAAQVETVFGYFNNQFQGHSPASCNQFKSLLSLPTVSPDALIIQPSLF
jgi:uncharacterized protein YecE (DUF72 family)